MQAIVFSPNLKQFWATLCQKQLMGTKKPRNVDNFPKYARSLDTLIETSKTKVHQARNKGKQRK